MKADEHSVSQDLLNELGQIFAAGASQGASMLSGMLGKQVHVQLEQTLNAHEGPAVPTNGDGTFIVQSFSGAVAGCIGLYIDAAAAASLTRTVSGRCDATEALDSESVGALREISNFVLNGALGALEARAGTPLSVQVPRHADRHSCFRDERPESLTYEGRLALVLDGQPVHARIIGAFEDPDALIAHLTRGRRAA